MKQVTVIGFNMHLVPKKELEDIIAENFDMEDLVSWMGDEVLIQAYNLQFTVADFAREILPVVTCVENDAPFVERIVKNAMTRWPWLVRGVAELCDQWTDAIRWAVLKDEIEYAWNEHTDLGFQIGVEDDEEADNEIFARQEEVSDRMSLAISEAKKIEEKLSKHETRYESVD